MAWWVVRDLGLRIHSSVDGRLMAASQTAREGSVHVIVSLRFRDLHLASIPLADLNDLQLFLDRIDTQFHGIAQPFSQQSLA